MLLGMYNPDKDGINPSSFVELNMRLFIVIDFVI